jgi:catalase
MKDASRRHKRRFTEAHAEGNSFINRVKSGAAVTVAAAICAFLIDTTSTGVRADEDVPVATQIVDALQKRFGVHPGYRANHAKGIVVEGNFKASPEAAILSTSPLFTGATIPITVRFSDASGIPDLPDAAPVANPHGMAIKFHLPDGGESDIVINALKFFVVPTAEDFRDLQLAAAASPPSAPKPTKLEEFLAAHPAVSKAIATLGIPDSFADEQYYGVDAFLFVDKANHKQAFRYIVAPERMVHLTKDEASQKSPNYLIEDLPQRLKAGPVIFHVKAQLAEPGDPTNDPSQPWPDARRVVDLGVLTIDRPVPDSAAAEKKLLFLPGNVTDGIEPSDDPLISARDGAYAVSADRRGLGQ